MGQQQILILVLVLVIVVLGIALGMQLFKTEVVQLTEDDHEQMMIETGEKFQAWYQKPAELGGGGKDWARADFNQVECPLDLSSPNGKSCTTEDHKVILLSKSTTEYFGISIIARIGGNGPGHMYSRILNIYPDSLVWENDWEVH